MKKVLVRLFVVFCLVTSSLLVAPFSVSKKVNAFSSQQLSAPFLGVNVYLHDRDTVRSLSSEDVDFDLSGLNMSCNSYRENSYGVACSLYTSPGTASITGTIDAHNTLNNYYLYEYEFILDNNYVGYVDTNFGVVYVNGNKFSITDNSGSITITINNYNLSVISTERWMFPIESFNVIYYCFNNNFPLATLVGVHTYQFPVFTIQQNQIIFGGRIAANDTHRMIMFVNRNLTSSSYKTALSLSSDKLEFHNYKIVQRLVVTSGGTTYLMISFDIVNTSADAFNYYITWNGAESKYMPIYCNTIKNDYITTDFAINFGLSNKILDSLDILANGTQNSNDSSDNLNEQTSDFTDSSSDLFNYEDSFNDSLNDSLEDINVQFDVGNQFGSKFLASAQWVKTQFDALTSTSPFGTLLSFSLILGLALLIIGKAVK